VHLKFYEFSHHSSVHNDALDYDVSLFWSGSMFDRTPGWYRTESIKSILQLSTASSVAMIHNIFYYSMGGEKYATSMKGLPP
jgi:hypothetical protein